MLSRADAERVIAHDLETELSPHVPGDLTLPTRAGEEAVEYAF